MLAEINTASVKGVEGFAVRIEADIQRGIPALNIVGLADTTVKESGERIRAALHNIGIPFPKGRIIINLSPAGERKRGSHFDLPIAMSILLAGKVIFGKDIEEYAFFGELSLDGRLHKCAGVLPMVMAMRDAGIKKIILPSENAPEALLVGGVEVLAADTLYEIIEHFNLTAEIPVYYNTFFSSGNQNKKKILDFEDVRGHENVKRAITVAAAGGHSILMMGSPSTGKTMLAERIPSVMPEMSRQEIIEATVIYSVAGLLDRDNPYITERPFRHPHQSTTTAGLLGGGSYPVPGEVSLAHRGVLFIDELGEFRRNTIEALRVPLEKKEVSLIRRGETTVFPADFLFVAATNPCRCGYYGDPVKECTCTEQQIRSYRAALSGPIMDRIDMHINLMPVSYDDLEDGESESSASMREKIRKAREIQEERYRGTDIKLNSQLEFRNIEKYAPADREGKALLMKAYDTYGLNPRTLIKVRRMSRTIADIEGCSEVNFRHIAEALQYRERL